MVGKQVLGWVQGGVACAISVGGGWGGCGARERARGVRGQAHRVVSSMSPPRRRRERDEEGGFGRDVRATQHYGVGMKVSECAGAAAHARP